MMLNWWSIFLALLHLCLETKSGLSEFGEDRCSSFHNSSGGTSRWYCDWEDWFRVIQACGDGNFVGEFRIFGIIWVIL